MEKILRFLKLILLAVSLSALAACGGGSGGGGSGGGTSTSTTPPSTTGITLSGTAATGAPIVGGAVTLKDSVGATAPATTDAQGNYSFDVSATHFPVMLKVQPNIPGAVPLFSAALTSGTANITPLTTLQVFEAVGKTDPSTIFNSGDFSKIGKSSLDQGKSTAASNLTAQYAANGLDLITFDPITTPMVANGAGADAILDHTNVAIIKNNASLTDSTGIRIPFASANEMTLAVDGMDGSNFTAFLSAPIVNWSNLSKDFGTNAGYVRLHLKDAGVPGIDQPRPFAPNIASPHVMLSNVPWTQDPTSYYTTIAIAQLKLQLKLAAQDNITAEANGGMPGPINIVTHSWGGIIAYIALSELSDPNSANYDPTIKVANLITMGSPVECLAGDCPNYDLPLPLGVGTLGAKISQNALPGYSRPILVPRNVTTWTNYWGNDDIISAKINTTGVKNRYVDCEGNLYGDIAADPTPYPCAVSNIVWTAAVASNDITIEASIVYQWYLNHSQYFSPTAGTATTLVDVDRLVSSSQIDASSAQTTTVSSPSTPPASPPTTFSLTASTPYCDTNNPAGPAVKLTWGASGGAVYYRLFKNNSAIGVNLVAAQLSFLNNLGLVAGQAYSYKVQAMNADGTTWSNTVPVTIPTDVCVTPPTSCIAPQVLQNGICVTPPLTCTLPQVLTNGVCVTPPTTCTAPKILQSGVCVTPPLTCTLPQVLTNGVCVIPPLPTATVSANPANVPASGQTTLTWSSTNATSCTASNGWSGSKATSGSQTVTVSSSPGTENFGLSCTNSAGQTVNTGFNVTVTGGPSLTPPIVQSMAATLITSTYAQMNGTINPNGLSTSAYFEYGITTSYGSTTGPGTFSGTSALTIQSGWAGLTPNTTYHYRADATNSAGTSIGSDVTFTTAAPSCTSPGAFSLSSATPYWDTGTPHSIAASLSWISSSNATSGYDIYRDGVNIFSASASNTTFQNYNKSDPTVLMAGSNHSYYIVAKNACGNTQSSNTLSVTLTNQVTVSHTNGLGLNLRTSPGYTNYLISNLPEGTIVTVNGGPTYAPVSSTSSDWWWFVSTSSGSGGWVWGAYLY